MANMTDPEDPWERAALATTGDLGGSPDLATMVADAVDQSRREQGWLDPDGVRRATEELNACAVVIANLRAELAQVTTQRDLVVKAAAMAGLRLTAALHEAVYGDTR